MIGNRRINSPPYPSDIDGCKYLFADDRDKQTDEVVKSIKGYQPCDSKQYISEICQSAGYDV